MSTVTEVVERFQSLPGLRAKSSLRLVAEVFGASDWVHGPGDDTAVIEDGEGYLLVGGEAIWPPLIQADPFAAGTAAVVANVNDVAATGGRSLALVDHVVAPETVARAVLEGIRFAAGLYGVPVVGGHLTIWDGPPSVSASVVGRAGRLLSVRNVAPGQALLLGCCLEGEMRKDFPFFSSIRQRAGRLAGDVGLLPRLAEEGHCAAAKDVSMAGVLGSLATMLEPTRCGAAVDLKALPRPEGVALAPWTSAFPTFAFLLCAPPAEADALRRAFRGRGLACEQVGAIDDTGRLRVSLGREESQLLDLTTESVTGLNGNSLAIAIEGESPSSGGDGRGTRPAPPSGASRGA